MAAAISALWVAFTFFVRKGNGPEQAKSPSAQKTVTTITGDKNSVAGRDIRHGANGLMLLLILIFFLLLTLILAGQFGTRIQHALFSSSFAIPTVQLSLGCGADNQKYPDEMNDEERKQLVRFEEIAELYADETVYVSVSIQKPCMMCECQRSLVMADNAEADRPESSIDKGSISYDQSTTQDRTAEFGDDVPLMWREGLELRASSPEDWAVGHFIYLPRYTHLNDAQYKKGAYGYYTIFDGLFTARYYFQTGAAFIHLDTKAPTATEADMLKCIRDERAPSFLNALLFGCSVSPANTTRPPTIEEPYLDEGETEEESPNSSMLTGPMAAYVPHMTASTLVFLTTAEQNLP
ncbi:hypothetical protein [Rhizobium leguminosarum]|uniref:hypothetical protein n=1 Tax=Rhizobium leguminosarum TaxID=384 RepID=UPI003F9A3450